MNNVNVNINAVNANCGIIRQIGMNPGLAGKFFTLSAKHAMKDYKKIKDSLEANPQNQELFINRPIRTFDIKSHTVLSQAVESDAAGNLKVVFNPGTDEEAKAAIVAGGTGFGEATVEAIKKALGSEDSGVIFANGKKLLKETNDLIDGEIAWIDSLINRLQKAKQSLETSKTENAMKVNEYYNALSASTPKDSVTIKGNTFEVAVEEAE